MSAADIDIFLMRGLVREAAHWLDFPDLLRRKMPRAAVHFLEIPGSGKYVAEPSPRSIAGLVDGARRDFIAARSSNGASSRPAAIFSMSLGGMVTFEWLRRYPGDFARAAIGNTSLRGHSRFWRRLRPSIYGTIAGALMSGAEGQERRILSMVANDGAARAAALPRWIEIHHARPITRRNFARQIGAALAYRPPIDAPVVPVILLKGAGDRLVHPSCSDAIANAWKLPIHTHPTAGHDLSLDAPGWVVSELAAWFGAI